MLENFQLGLQVFITLPNILAVFIGVTAGIFIGAIPGLTATMSVALLVPLTFTMSPVTGLAMLIGVYKGGIYGGSITAILINTPGTPAAAATALDGYPLAKKGKALKALKMAIYASVMADTFSDIVLILVAAPLAIVALKLGPPELTALLILALTIVGLVSGKSLVKGLLVASLGVLFSTVGMDFMTGTPRFTFDSLEMAKGFPLIPVLIGLFAIPEILVQVEEKVRGTDSVVLKRSPRAEDNRVNFQELKGCSKTIFRSAIVGTFIGAIPGIGSVISSFISYGMAKRGSKHPEEFGYGSLEGVAAAEAGNNAVCGATLIPLLTLGIPGDSVTAVMLGAFLIQGLVPGPELIPKHPDVIYGLFVALMVANIANLLIANVGIRFFARVASVSKTIVFPTVAILCVVGSYAVENSLFDVKSMLFFGIVGYFMRKFDFPIPPFLIAFILGPMVENPLRQSLMISGGSPAIFFTSPISLAFIVLTGLSIFTVGWRQIKGKASGP
jgi:putative tricarboxylic transport membrane protein